MITHLFRFLIIAFVVLSAVPGFSQEAQEIAALKSELVEEIADLKAELKDEATPKTEHHQIEKEIARNYLALEDFENAIIHLQNSIKLQEDPAAPEYLALGRLLIQQQKFMDAVTVLEAGQKKFPDSMDMAFLLSFPLRYLEKWADAVKQYEKIEELSNAQTASGLNHEVYFQFGSAVERTGDFDKAAQLFQKSLERIPDGDEQNQFRATVLNYLGYMWLENDKNIDVAGELIKKASKLEPDSGAIADSLGWFYFKKERYIEALNELVRAEALMEEGDPTVLDHIAQAYHKTGNQKEALAYMEKAVKLAPENADYKARLAEYSKK